MNNPLTMPEAMQLAKIKSRNTMKRLILEGHVEAERLPTSSGRGHWRISGDSIVAMLEGTFLNQLVPSSILGWPTRKYKASRASQRGRPFLRLVKSGQIWSISYALLRNFCVTKKPPGFTQGASFYSTNSHCHKPGVPGSQMHGIISALARYSLP